MKAKIYSLDLIDYENWAYWPDEMTNFFVAAEALIGTDDNIGSEIFSFQVCSPKWYSKNKLEKPAFARHIIFMNEYDETALKDLVYKLVENTTGKSWREIATKLSRFMFWEFEDYQPSAKNRK